MKKTAKIISASLATLLITSSAVTAFAAEEKDINVSLRIEGIDSCLLYNSYELSEGSTASDLIQYADKLSDAITVTGAENGYITDVNGETAGKFGGWDGWQYTVNAVSPSVGVNDYTLSNNDTVVLYSGLVQKVGGVSLLKKGITDVFFITKDFVNGARPPFCFASAGKYAICFEAFCNFIH